MYEIHDNEQYFFDEPTIEHLAAFVSRFRTPCCLCAPLLGERLVALGVDVRILDVDERFAGIPGFRHYDLHRPEWIGEEYDLILCDPPFFNVSLSRLFTAIRELARHDSRQPIIIGYLRRRANALLDAFASFELRATGYRPGYRTVRRTEKNEIEFFSNLTDASIRLLTEGTHNPSEPTEGAAVTGHRGE